MLRYLDSSAFLKVFKREPESDAMVNYFTQNLDHLFTSELTITELLGNLMRLGIPTHIADRALAGITLIPIRQEILHQAADFRGAGLRSLDAIHLASALSVRGNLAELVTYDHHLAAFSAGQGVSVVAPS
jgi:predicted nucleic acid-binding protein